MNKDDLILVVMGGTSSERPISLKSGEAMLGALLKKGYNAQKFVLEADNATDIIKMHPACAVLALHGKGGEDGTIQGMLELAGIPYTGSGVAASAMCMDKIFTKKTLEYTGLLTAKFISILPHEEFDAEKFAAKALMELGLPVVLKAPCEGSSVGVEIVRDADRLPQACREIYEYEHQLLAEEFLPGMEMSVPVMKDGGEIKPLPIIEIVSENEFYDFESKYQAGMSHHIIPARVPDYISEQINDLAVETYKYMNCDGLVRIDFMLGKYGRPHVVEVNTLPGMTETSLVPDAARAIGIPFEDIVEKILLDAFDRHILQKAEVR